MQILGLILLIATSWYIWKLSSNFLDEKTKKELDDNFQLFKKQLDELKQKFSQDNLKSNKVGDHTKTVDIAATLARILGIKPPEICDGDALDI